MLVLVFTVSDQLFVSRSDGDFENSNAQTAEGRRNRMQVISSPLFKM